MWKNLDRIFVAIIVLFAAQQAIADSSAPRGRLVFLGKTANNQHSVWLSETHQGIFEIEARQQIVDEWTQSNPGLHVTLSPFVSNGSGDIHSLYEVVNGELVFLDKDDQQGGIIFPPLPGGLPPGEISHPINAKSASPNYLSTTPTSTSNQTGTQQPQKPSPSGNLFPGIAGGLSRNPAFSNANKVPITPGRRFEKQPLLNLWIDARYFDVKDFRYGLDRKGCGKNTTIGADYKINDDLVLGAMVVANKNSSNSFQKNWLGMGKGISVGPYFGYRILPTWALTGTFSYGVVENHNQISILNSKYHTKIYSASIMARGVYNFCSLQLQPKPAIYYNYYRNAKYNLNGTIRNFSISAPIPAFHFPFGYAQFAVEATRPFNFTKNEIDVVPYLELGINYAFVRPNGGRILTNNLTLKKITPWSGLTRVGLRTMLTSSFFVEATASYLSIGQPHLNVWLSRIFFSWAI